MCPTVLTHVRKDNNAPSRSCPARSIDRSRQATLALYLWLRKERWLSADSQRQLESLTRLRLKTARTYQPRLAFQEIYSQPTRDWGALFLDL